MRLAPLPRLRLGVALGARPMDHDLARYGDWWGSTL